ncbi:MAG: DNA repair protein RecN [Treponema sp.]
MLEELDIKDFALIDSAHIEFNKGFTVLSGETGAGKSILIGSLAFVLGGKAGLEQIRTGTHEAQVTASFLLESALAESWLKQHEIESEDGRILLRRIIKDTGKSSSWIGSTPVTRADLADFSSFLVDIHGQHEQQSLMKVGEHRRYLDSYAGINTEVASFTEIYSQLVEKRKTLENLNTNETDRANRIEILEFAIKEITDSKLKQNEDEDLEAEENKLSSYEKLYDDIAQINSIISNDEGSIIPLLKKLKSLVPHAAALDKSLENLDQRLQSSYYEIDDISEEFKKYESSLVYDPDRLTQVQDRLDLIYNLKKKYASSINAPLCEVSDYLDKAQTELETLTGSAADKSALEKEIKELEKKVYEAAKAIHIKRASASDKMSKSVEEILSKLGMGGTKFNVALLEKPGDDVTQKCGPYGMDNIEFLIAANPGSPLLPLAKIASGGEISRVMLALKTILAEEDTVGTLVFDEIDTGIGGEVAVAVGSHLKQLSYGNSSKTTPKKQVLCITHLASIAVYADNQIKIQKGVEGNSTSTQVFPVSGKARIQEIARMLSGDPTSEESLEHAASMLQKFGGK